MALAASFEFVVLGQFLPAPFVVAAALFALSFVHGQWKRASIRLLLMCSILIPLGALKLYLEGKVVVAVPVFDGLVFGWLFLRARNWLRQGSA